MVSGLILGVAIHFGQIAQACAMPDQVNLARTLLNIHYPDATFVIGATWTLQMDGTLDMPNPERVTARGTQRAAMEEAERREALRALADFKTALHLSRREQHALSIVLVERMHRERLMPVQPAAFDPLAASSDNDLLLVTTEPALHALTKGDMTVEQSLSHGVIRLYGTNGQMVAFMSEFAQIGSQPLVSTSTSTHWSPGRNTASAEVLRRAALKHRKAIDGSTGVKQQN